VDSLAQRVLSHIRRQELLRAGDRVGVAISGGIDSVALLRLLLELRGELGIVLSVVHFNHKLRGPESDADEEFVAALAREHGLEFYSDSDDVAQHAAEEHVSLETAARELRYGFFRSLFRESPSAAKGPLPASGADRSGESAAPFKSEPYDAEVKVPTLSLQKAQGQGWGTPPPHLDKVLTGHTLDDQAETVLMRLIRGAGLRGLGGIYPRIPVEDDDEELAGEIVRPLLPFRRSELERYLKDIEQSWREDSTNCDASLTRNRVRQLLVPLLEREFNPSVAGNLAELAEIARGEEDYWENEVAGWMGTAVHWSEPEWVRETSSGSGLVQIALAQDDSLRTRIANAAWLVMNASVSRLWFLGEPVAVQRRLVKAVGEQAGIPLEFRHVEEILRFAVEDGPSGKELSLPLGWRIGREEDALTFLTPDLRTPWAPQDYDYELPVPGRADVPEISSTIEVRCVSAAEPGYNPERLLDAVSLTRPLRVRNWRPGDRFWPAHTKSPKKIKELLQERRVAQPERRLWPVIASGDEIVWVQGFPPPAKHQAKQGRPAVEIIERPLPAD